jgi:hypothetical protein
MQGASYLGYVEVDWRKIERDAVEKVERAKAAATQKVQAEVLRRREGPGGGDTREGAEAPASVPAGPEATSSVSDVVLAETLEVASAKRSRWACSGL